FGTTAVGANAVSHPNAPIVAVAATPDGGGYWLAGSDGGIFSYGDAQFYGSTGALHLNAPIVGIASTPDGKGYWLVARDGGIFTYGDASFYGSAGALRLNAPVVGMAATRDGGGYWLVASDGGIFSYGDAQFHGSTGGLSLNAPVVGLAAAPGGGGYWLVGADGGIFSYGTAPFYGSTGALHLNKPIVGMASAPGGGYWLVASDGGLFSYGDASYFGSLGGETLPAPVVGMAAAPGGTGYWLVLGSPDSLDGKVVGIDPGHNGLNYTDPSFIDQPVFNGVSDEPCDTAGTETASGYTEAQFNFDVATDLQADLEAAGATVVMTRTDNASVGPCVTTRAAIINDADANVAVDIHADGGPPSGSGFTIFDPVADGPNDAVIGSSAAFGSLLDAAFASGTSMPPSDYSGVGGLELSSDLAGLNLTTVPKVLIECGNMQNATDAALLVTPAFQQAAASAIAQAVTEYLTGPAG
ncbi:MAG TPA: N-acetylmuramoyl-L-alanine amidase, partial [Acidimicrobiales bacterium]|nr:N-acetylmuramoyl-L-alanine amidase [Acidimicrobiales bacterium]